MTSSIGPQVQCYLSYLVPFQAAAKRPQQLSLTPIPVSALKGKRPYYTLFVVQKQDPGTIWGWLLVKKGGGDWGSASGVGFFGCGLADCGFVCFVWVFWFVLGSVVGFGFVLVWLLLRKSFSPGNEHFDCSSLQNL